MTPTRSTVRRVLGTLFLGAGALQVARRDTFVALVPERLGEHRAQAQSVMAAGLGLMGASFFAPRLRALTRVSVVPMLVATLPAAVDQVRHPERMAALGLPMPAVVARIPAQLAVACAVWYATGTD